MDEGRKSRLEARNALADPNRECGRLSSETRSVSKALRDVAASYVLRRLGEELGHGESHRGDGGPRLTLYPRGGFRITNQYRVGYGEGSCGVGLAWLILMFFGGSFRPTYRIRRYGEELST